MNPTKYQWSVRYNERVRPAHRGARYWAIKCCTVIVEATHGFGLTHAATAREAAMAVLTEMTVSR